MNEFFNGLVKRNIGYEQSFLSNTSAALVTIASYYGMKSSYFVIH